MSNSGGSLLAWRWPILSRRKWLCVCVTVGEILINDKKGIHAQILSVASVHRLKQSPEKCAWTYHWFHSKKKRKIISREDVRRRTTIGRDYFCAYRTKVVFWRKKTFFFAKFEYQGKRKQRTRTVNKTCNVLDVGSKSIRCLARSLTGWHGSGTGNLFALSMSKSAPATILNWKLSTNWSVNFFFLRRVCELCAVFIMTFVTNYILMKEKSRDMC